MIEPDKLKNATIAIPGKYTTANLLLSIAWPEAEDKKEYLFSDIEDVLLRDEADAGLIIHETRFTYHKRGLIKIADMGTYWEKMTHLPIPLGVIIINKRIPKDIALKFNRILRRSIEFAWANSQASYDFVSSNAREMDSTVMNSHIRLFVNEFSLNLGTEGRKALTELYRIAHERGITPEVPDSIFLT
jgi:1,4-dihydroxy-6-naphthoate synthase